jgi:hypothetical protein
MNKSFISKSMFICITLALVMTANAEPNNVDQILKSNGFDWFFGTWETTTDSNTPATATFEVVMDGYAISSTAKVGSSYQYTGLIYYDPAKKIIVNTGVDNDGRIFGGSWKIEGSKLVLNLEQTSPDGSVNSYVRYLSQVNPEKMLSVTYSSFEGLQAREPMNTLEFTRKK